jgi:hypothetical protein
MAQRGSSSLGALSYGSLCFISFCCVLSSAKMCHVGGTQPFESGKGSYAQSVHARTGVDWAQGRFFVTGTGEEVKGPALAKSAGRTGTLGVDLTLKA